MCIISCILGRLSWNDGSCLVDFSLDVDLRCNLDSILKALLHWHVDCWCGRAFCSYVYGRICEGRFCGLIHCCGDAPVPLRSRALRNSGRVPLSLQKSVSMSWTVSVIRYHFNEDTRETMQEKINRTLVTEANRMAVY